MTDTDPRVVTVPVLTAQAMRAADHYTMETFGIPSFTLMESAGRTAADRIAERFGPFGVQPVVVLCGKGNNGGDGLVVARQLLARQAHVHVVLMTDPDALNDDPARNLRLLHHFKAESSDAHRLNISVAESVSALAGALAPIRPALYIDAFLGTGLTSDVREPIRGAVDWLNEQDAPVAALDIPTGVHADTGAVLGTAVQADYTVTMAAPKAGLLMGDGAARAGTVDTIEIGIPDFVIDRMVDEYDGCARLTTAAAVRAWVPRRAPDAYKYSVGMALVVGGAPGYTGAPVMASMAAARVGAGYVACACPRAAEDTLATKMTAVPTVGLPDTDEGGIDPDDALDALTDSLGKARSLLVGPGLGRATSTQQFVRALVQQADRPTVIDADGLNALAGHMDDLTEHAQGRWILTPHAGEFKRLAGDDVDLTDRVQVATTYAARWNSVLLLKGMPSIVADPQGNVFIGQAGNPALATAGTGDVLAGLCAGLLAQGLSPLRAAACALHIGGTAADRYAVRYDARCMLATDLLDQIPHVFNEHFS